MIRRKLMLLFSKFNLMVIFSLSIFVVILVTTGISCLIVLLQLHFGILQWSDYLRPESGLIFIFTLSLIIGSITIILGGKIAFQHISKLLVAMKELSNGNFDVKIEMKGLIRPKEIVEFTEEFNAMATELRSIEMLRSDFVNNFSHEFKTPIVSLRGFAKLLKEGNLTPEERDEYLDIIISESDRLAALATNVLNLSKIENQALIAEKKEFNLSEQVRRVTLMMESKWSEKNLDLEVDLEEVNFYGNTELLSQVWINLMDNAIKFSKPGGKLQITLQELPDSVQFKIRDYGCGMDKATQSRIFDKFYQGDTSHASEGNGLGLTVVNKIIDLYKGQMTVESIPGEGTLILIILPNRTAKAHH